MKKKRYETALEPDPQGEKGIDWILHPDCNGHGCIWVKVGELLVYVYHTPDGIGVETMPASSRTCDDTTDALWYPND